MWIISATMHYEGSRRTIMYCIVLYCIVSIHLYNASCSAHQSEALPVRETQRECSVHLHESSRITTTATTRTTCRISLFTVDEGKQSSYVGYAISSCSLELEECYELE